MKKKITAKEIAITGLMLAICIVSQFFKNTSIFITGPIVNACLILCTLAAGLVPGLILSAITPITAFFITGNPVMAAIPLMIVMIMLGNMILVFFVWLLGKRSKVELILGMVLGSLVKGAFMGLTISVWLLPSFLPEKMLPKLAVLKTNFSLYQVITALIGSVIAFIVWIPVKKVLNKGE